MICVFFCYFLSSNENRLLNLDAMVRWRVMFDSMGWPTVGQKREFSIGNRDLWSNLELNSILTTLRIDEKHEREVLFIAHIPFDGVCLLCVSAIVPSKALMNFS